MLVDLLVTNLDNQQHPALMDNPHHLRHIHHRFDTPTVVALAPVAVSALAAVRVSAGLSPFPVVVAVVLQVAVVAAVVIVADALEVELLPEATRNEKV